MRRTGKFRKSCLTAALLDVKSEFTEGNSPLIWRGNRFQSRNTSVERQLRSYEMKLTIQVLQVPCYNEEGTLEITLFSLPREIPVRKKMKAQAPLIIKPAVFYCK